MNNDGITLSDTPFSDLLPHSITHSPEIIAASRALDVFFTDVRKGADKIPLWKNIDSVDEPLMSTLALSFSLAHEYTWKLAESLTVKRNLLRKAIDIHRYKGTPWAIREIVRLLGFGEITIIEGKSLFYDGEGEFNGVSYYGDNNGWAVFWVILNQPITNDQADLLRQAIQETAPVRSELRGLDYTSVPIRYNEVATYNGDYNYGSYKNNGETR